MGNVHPGSAAATFYPGETTSPYLEAAEAEEERRRGVTLIDRGWS